MMHTNLIKIFTSLLFFFAVCCFSQNIDTLKTKNIDEVTINQEKKIILKLSNGKYDINVVGTPFQEHTDAWEALKTIPILKVEDQGEISVFNKQLRLEINGILVQMPSNEIEGYIKNIDPKNIKNIQVITTPNSSYSADIEAVINIVLHYKLDNYKIGLTSNNGIKTHFLSSNGINTTFSHKKVRGYLNYNYSYYQPVNNSRINYKILNGDTDIDSEEKSKFNNHNIISNFEWSLNKKIKIVLAQDFSFRDNSSDISFSNNNEENILNIESDRDLFKFSQILNYDLNNSNIRIGSQQVISNTLFNNYTVQQEVVTKVPITNYFVDYTNSNEVGETLVGIKIGNVISNNNTLNSLQNLKFKYDENVISSYLNQTIDISDQQNISFGVRYESTNIELNTNDNLDKRNLDNLLYNVSYQHFNEKKGKGSTFSFKKILQRPNYNYLNKYSINNNVIGFVGNENINPSKYYVLGYEYFSKRIIFSAQTSYVDDFLSTFFDVNNGKILNTYTNFNKAYISAVTFGYNYDKYKFWRPNISFDGTYFLLRDEKYNDILSNSTPRFTLNMKNRFEINKSTIFNLNFNFTSKYSDGLLNHGQTNKLDFLFLKRFKNLDITFYIYDILKGMVEKDKVESYKFSVTSEEYRDNRIFGLSLRWNIVSKKFKDYKTDKIEDDNIDRL